MSKHSFKTESREMCPQRTEATHESSALMGPSPLGLDYDGHNLVFVVGCPRSGTTWLQRLLSGHPKIRTGQESHVFRINIGPQLRFWRKMADARRRGVGLACYFTERKFLRILKAYLCTLLEPMVAPLGQEELFLEKTPRHALFLREIFELLPRARVIHILRDPRDVVSSLLARDKWLSYWAPRTARDAAAMWAEDVRAVRSVALNVAPSQFHEVTYEDLSRYPVEVLRGCTDFLGLKWDDAEIVKAVDANKASKARANGGGTAIPLHGEASKRSEHVVEPKGFIRKAKIGAWKEDLSLYQEFRVWHAVHLDMESVGYRWSTGMESAFACASTLATAVKRALARATKRQEFELRQATRDRSRIMQGAVRRGGNYE